MPTGLERRRRRPVRPARQPPDAADAPPRRWPWQRGPAGAATGPRPRPVALASLVNQRLTPAVASAGGVDDVRDATGGVGELEEVEQRAVGAGRPPPLWMQPVCMPEMATTGLVTVGVAVSARGDARVVHVPGRGGGDGVGVTGGGGAVPGGVDHARADHVHGREHGGAARWRAGTDRARWRRRPCCTRSPRRRRWGAVLVLVLKPGACAHITYTVPSLSTLMGEKFHSFSNADPDGAAAGDDDRARTTSGWPCRPGRCPVRSV